VGPRRDIEQLADSIDKLLDLERFVEEIVGPNRFELLDTVLFHHARDADDADIIHVGIGPHHLADVFPVDIGEHDVEDDEVGMILFDSHSGLETVIDGADLKAAIPEQDIPNEFHQLFIVIDDENAVFGVFQGIQRDAVFPHEVNESIAGNATEAASRNAESLQLTGVEAANDGLLADLADLRCFSSRKDRLACER